MSKIARLPKPKVATLDLRVGSRLTVADVRITGRRLQARRWSLWKANPHCAMCGRFVGFSPDEFEVDHIVALGNGGQDVDENCQILCVWTDETGKHGCHIDKTERDLAAMRGS